MIHDLVSSKIDAILFPDTEIDKVIANGTPIIALKPYAFLGYSGIAVEKENNTSSKSLVNNLIEITHVMHQDRTLTSIIMNYFNNDYS
ncbi:hypothetical protein [Methanospirillum lacunae]|uniref:hypothetical protein n=1 Tax=Methanospirillum lacunae TaxID=668570 RepID=UPI0015E84D81